MKTLEEHNKEALWRYALAKEKYLTGISCPECGQELYDPTPGVVLASDPPQRNVKCSGCGFQGYAFK